MTYYDNPHPLAAENDMLKRLLRELIGLVPNTAAMSQPVVTARALVGMPLGAVVEEPADRLSWLRQQFEQDDCA